MDLGLLLIRLVIGALFLGHGAQKLFGWFGGHGPDGTGGFFHSLGHRPGRPMAVLAGLSEAGGGLLLALGLLTPLGAAAIAGMMLVASRVHWSNGLWVTNGGYELPLVFGVAASALAFTGPGRWSLDNAVGLDRFHGFGWGLAAVVLALVAGGVALMRAAATLRRERDSLATHAYPSASAEQQESAAAAR